MQESAAQSLVNLIGSLVQLGSALFLASLFFLLGRASVRRPYFRLWSWGWLATSGALMAIGARSALVPSFAERLMQDHSPQLAWLLVAYIAGKLMFCAFIFAGTKNWVSGMQGRLALSVAALFSVLFGTVVVTLMPSARWIIIAQAPLIALAFGSAAWMLLTLPVSRRSLGTRITGAAFAITALQWLAYLAAFARGDGSGSVRGGILSFVFYSSYLDVLMQTIVGYGMVLLFSEDGKRETVDAHAELAVAHSELLRESLYDPLTGALNRRAFHDGVGLETVKAGFGTVLVVDADNLKEVNDRRGHSAGDALLKHLVASLRAGMRATDRIYRWGGDEFVVLLPSMPSAMAASRIEALIAQAPPVSIAPGRSDEHPLRLQASVGAAEFSGAERLDDAVARADAAMYQRKRERRLVPLRLEA